MNCKNCNFENSPAAKFCVECGQKLAYKCRNCAATLPAGAKFCVECGTKVGSKPIEEKPAIELKNAERRQLTVMFCDLVGSTAISDKMDPEDFRQIILDYQEIARKVVTRYGGHIAQYLGDGLVIYFGYPKGLEDAPTEAVRCGLGLLESLKFGNEQFKKQGKPELSIRIAVHTGLVVVDYNIALGDTTNIAASLEGLAEKNNLVISHDTFKLVEGWFEIEAMGAHQLSGIPEPIEVFKVIHESGAKSRLDAARSKGLTPLIGRKEETKMLLRDWEQTKRSNGQVVLINGEAGIGKSRLVENLKETISLEADAWLTEIRCFDHYKNTSFYPIIDHLERIVLSFDDKDSIENKLVKLEGFLIQSGLDPIFNLPIYADLLSIPLPDASSKELQRFQLSQLSPTGRKKRIFESVLNALLSRANKQPILLIIEDIHWADASTLEWFELLMTQVPTHPIFTVCTTRPGFKANWLNRSNAKQLTLQRLDLNRIEAICMHQTKNKKLPDEVLQQIRDKTDGIPLFVEELTRMILESEILIEREHEFVLSKPLEQLAIPSTLKDSLLSRIDKLNTVKELVQIGSVLGRKFSFQLLKAVSGRAQDKLQDDLNKLIEAEMWFQQGILPNASIIFKHALIQDIAYDSLLNDRKKLLHARVTKVLQEEFPALIESKPELLAFHLTEAGLNKEAILKWEEAGALAAQRFSTKEAVHHLRKGLSMLDIINDEVFKIEKETDLLAMLTPILQLSYGNKDAESMGLRWLKAAEASRKIDKIHDAYVGQFTFNMFSTKYFESEPYGKKIIELGAKREDAFMQATSFFFYGIFQSLLGNHINSAAYYERAKALYDPALHLNKSYYHTGNILANILTYGSTTYHLLGKIERASKDVEEARKLVYIVKQPSSIYANAAFYSRLFLLRKEYDKVESVAIPALNLAKENGDTFLVALLSYYLNTAYALLGDKEALLIAHNIMKNLYEKYKAFHIAFMVFIAEAYLKFKNFEACREVINHAEIHMQKTQEGLFSPALIRLKGDLLLLQDSDVEGAHKIYLSAAQVAKSQSDLWHELLAVKSLVQLNHQDKNKFNSMLEDIYNQFESGFDTQDLKEANDLIKK